MYRIRHLNWGELWRAVCHNGHGFIRYACYQKQFSQFEQSLTVVTSFFTHVRVSMRMRTFLYSKSTVDVITTAHAISHAKPEEDFHEANRKIGNNCFKKRFIKNT